MSDDDTNHFMVAPPRAGLMVPRDVDFGSDSVPWNSDPNYGREVVIPQDTQPGVPVSILGAKLYPIFPTTWCLSCRIEYDDDPATWAPASGALGRAFSLLGLVQFGTGGAQQQIEFDWIQGTMITLPLATVKVAVAIDPLVNASIPPNTRASCVLAPGSPCRDLAPTRTLYLGDGGGDLTLRIPPFAKSFQLYGASFNAGTVIEVKTGPEATDGVIAAFTFADLEDARRLGAGPRLFGAAKYLRVAGTWSNGNLSFLLDA